MIADELRRQADAFLDLAELADHITRRQVEPRPRGGAALGPAPGPAPGHVLANRPPPIRATPADPFRELPDLPE
jgi:hypothetical protein